MKRFLCLLLSLSLLLSGCSVDMLQAILRNDYFQQYLPEEPTQPVTGFDQFVYTRPDMQAHDAILEYAILLAETETDVDVLMDAVYDYYDAYDLVDTGYALSYIYYCRDPSDAYWSEEYNYCNDVISDIEAGLEDLYCALAKSPIRQELETDAYFGADFFDDYEDGGVWDEELLGYMDEEGLLEESFYALSDEAANADISDSDYYALYTAPLVEVLIELVQLRKQMAEHLEYADVADMAYQWYHYRDYTPEEVEVYLLEIANTLAPLYMNVLYDYDWQAGSRYCSSTQAYEYVESMARAVGGDLEASFDFMSENGLYDNALSSTKVDISYATYIASYEAPYIFMNPSGTARDKLTFIHEFGHFTNSYLCNPSYAGTDVAEVHSQASEYLSLFYAEDGMDLEKEKLVDCLGVYVEQSLFSLFELRLYQLSEAELTVENVIALFAETCEDFGFYGVEDTLFTQIPHFYVEPMYMISYVVSNDVAFQVYQLEKQQAGAGLAIYQDILYSQDTYLVAFAQEYGLESPFEEGRLKGVANILESVLT